MEMDTPELQYSGCYIEEFQDSQACEPSLQCGWTGCYQTFESMDRLTLHLTNVHLFASHHCDQPLHCFWQGCDNFDAQNHNHLTVHVLYHAYHTELKACATKAIEKSQSNPPQCQLIAYCSSLPDLPPNGFTCMLDHGRCMETFYSFHSFHIHVKNHVYSSALTERKCTWLGCNRTALFKACATKAIEKSQSNPPQCQLIAYCSSLPDLPPNGFTCMLDHGRCMETFYSFHSFHIHVKNHVYSSALTERKCTWIGCNRTALFKTKFFLNNHLRTHTGAKKFACPQCGAMFANIEKLKGHCVRQILDEKSKMYKCTFCKIAFASYSLLRDHLRTHVKLYQCSKCALPFAKKSALRNHWKFKHSEERMFPCPMELCNYSAKTRNDLLKHLKSHEQKEKLSCEFCDKKFKSQFGFRYHMESEHNVKARSEYVCHLCGPETVFHRGVYLSGHLIKKHGMHRPPGQKFSYIKADDGKLYLAQDELHEVVGSTEVQSMGSGVTPETVSSADTDQIWDQNSEDMPLNYVIHQHSYGFPGSEESSSSPDFYRQPCYASTPRERYIDSAGY